MIRYEIPVGWTQIKLRAEPLGQWTVVHQVTGTGYGPLALAALKLPPQPTAGLDHEAAIALGVKMERALRDNVPESVRPARMSKRPL